MLPKRILIIEDDPELAEALQVRLDLQGFECLVASDGRQGLELAHEEKPDLIILDIELPHIDGFQICRLLKFDLEYKEIPIIILTVKDSYEDRSRGKEVGADYYMAKPFDIKQLVATVMEFLSEQRDSRHPGYDIGKYTTTEDKRRRHQRIQFGLKVSEEEDWLIVDLSFSGCFIKTAHPLPINSKVSLNFQIAVQGKNVTISTEGIVRRQEPGGMGIEFVNLDPADERLLVEFLNAG